MAFSTTRICESEGLGVGSAAWSARLASGRLFLKQAHEPGLNGSFPVYLTGMLGPAMPAGYADGRFAAMVKVLR
ncbi:hypothetical protein [Variovorax sp. 22077]|uniref:hypothetical protein n=1 Tax=Variovorax sp. 22077 TaxID=3453867 RepID=UPI003F840951